MSNNTIVYDDMYPDTMNIFKRCSCVGGGVRGVVELNDLMLTGRWGGKRNVKVNTRKIELTSFN